MGAYLEVEDEKRVDDVGGFTFYILGDSGPRI